MAEEHSKPVRPVRIASRRTGLSLCCLALLGADASGCTPAAPAVVPLCPDGTADRPSPLVLTPKLSAYTAGPNPEDAWFTVSNPSGERAEFRVEKLEFVSGPQLVPLQVTSIATSRPIGSDDDVKAPPDRRVWASAEWISVDHGEKRWLMVEFDPGPLPAHLPLFAFRGHFLTRDGRRVVLETQVQRVIRHPVLRR
jgi:hypothetical protein